MPNGTSLYRLRVPKDVPARQFWSAIAESNETSAPGGNPTSANIMP